MTEAPLQTMIESTLQSTFSPTELEVINESNRHNVPPGAESHFKIVMLVPDFEGQSLVQRHRAVNTALKPALNAGVHALALHLFTAEEWSARQKAEDSPKCRGGSL